MAVSPPVFLAFGNPDRIRAHQLASQFWQTRVECYNYMVKPTEDRGVSEMPHRCYLNTCHLFVGLISRDSVQRDAVIAEFEWIDWLVAEAGHWAKRAFIFLIESPADRFRVTLRRQPDVSIAWWPHETAEQVFSQIVAAIDPIEFAEWQEKWDVNRGLFPQAWQELDSVYRNPNAPTTAEKLPKPPAA